MLTRERDPGALFLPAITLYQQAMAVLRRFVFGIWVVVLLPALLLGAGPSLAQTQIRFDLRGAGDSLRDDIVAASLLAAAKADGTTATQDLLAAAQADYARILGALYANARYGGVITISVDGREAAGLQLLSPPPRIGSIVVRVDPGPLYSFGEAQVAPLPQGAAPPEALRQGQPAFADAIRDAGTQTLDAWRAQGHAKARIDQQRGGQVDCKKNERRRDRPNAGEPLILVDHQTGACSGDVARPRR